MEELILPQLEGHLQAAEAKARAQLSAAEAFVSSGGWVSHLVLAELTWVLSSVYELTQHQIATVVEMLVDWRSAESAGDTALAD